MTVRICGATPQGKTILLQPYSFCVRVFSTKYPLFYRTDKYLIKTLPSTQAQRRKRTKNIKNKYSANQKERE